nr:hypothetical protein [Streptomyces hygroscopicus]
MTRRTPAAPWPMPGAGVVEPFDAAVVDAYVVGGPPGAELGADRGRLDEAAEAYRAMAERRAVKAMLTV